jgi:hypothetical protein
MTSGTRPLLKVCTGIVNLAVFVATVLFLWPRQWPDNLMPRPSTGERSHRVFALPWTGSRANSPPRRNWQRPRHPPNLSQLPRRSHTRRPGAWPCGLSRPRRRPRSLRCCEPLIQLSPEAGRSPRRRRCLRKRPGPRDRRGRRSLFTLRTERGPRMRRLRTRPRRSTGS